MLNIPTPDTGVPFQTQRTALDGTAYLIRWAYCVRGGYWTIDIIAPEAGEISAENVLMGKVVTIGRDLLDGVNATRRPQGRLFAVSTDGGREKPGETDLGTRVSLVYLEPGEVI